MNIRRVAVSGLKWSTIGTIGRAIFQLLQISILTRFLPKEAFGLVAMGLFLVQFSNIFVDLGMTSAILHHQNATQKEYSSIYWLNIMISILIYLLLIVVTPFASSFYGQPELNVLIPLLGLNLLLVSIGRQHRTIMQKNFRFKPIALIDLSSYFIGLVIAITLAYKGFGVYSLVYSTLGASLISNLLFLFLNYKLNPVIFRFKAAETKPFLKVGGFTTGSSILDFLSREADVLIIGKLLGAESLGLYTLAKQIVQRMYSIVNPIILNVLSPLLSSIQKEKERVKSYYLRIISLLASLNFPIYLLIIVLSKEILIILYGVDYASAYLILSFLAVSFLTDTINNPVGSLQISTGRTDLGFKWTIFRVIVAPLVIFIAAHFNVNIVAASIAALSILSNIPLWYIQIRPMINISLKGYLSQFVRSYILLLFIVAVFLIISHFYVLPWNNFANIFIKLMLSLLVFFGCLWIFDRKSITNISSTIELVYKKSNAH